MHHRSIAVFVIACVALVGGGCAHNSNRDYEEVLMPLQTGSVLHRRVMMPAEHEKKTKKKKGSASTTAAPPAKPKAQ